MRPSPTLGLPTSISIIQSPTDTPIGQPTQSLLEVPFQGILNCGKLAKLFLGFFFFNVCMFHLHVYVRAPHPLVPEEPEEGIGSPGTGVTDGCEPPCGCWEQSSCPLEEQQMVLIAEPSLQP